MVHSRNLGFLASLNPENTVEAEDLLIVEITRLDKMIINLGGESIFDIGFRSFEDIAREA